MDAASLVDAILSEAKTAFAPETTLAELTGWDSLQTVRLVLKLEQTLNRDLTDEELEGLLRIEDVRKLVKGC